MYAESVPEMSIGDAQSITSQSDNCVPSLYAMAEDTQLEVTKKTPESVKRLFIGVIAVLIVIISLIGKLIKCYSFSCRNDCCFK